jgi:hypothetical protein
MTIVSEKAQWLAQNCHPEIHQTRPMPIVVGAPRSGTTLLRFMLDSHPELAIPPETGFLSLASSFEGKGDALRERFIRALITYPKGSPNWPDFEISEKTFRAELARLSPFTISDGYRAFYRLYAGRFGKPRWGDKTPLYCLDLPLIRRFLPETRFIHIIRDGRDVALSLRRMWFSPGSAIETLAAYWRECVLAARGGGLDRSDYLEVRYDTLILNTPEVLRKICRFIDLDYDSSMLRSYIRAPERIKEHKGRTFLDGRTLTQEQRMSQQQRTTEPPDPSCVFAWRAAMSASERERFGCVARDVLQALGYEI